MGDKSCGKSAMINNILDFMNPTSVLRINCKGQDLRSARAMADEVLAQLTATSILNLPLGAQGLSQVVLSLVANTVAGVVLKEEMDKNNELSFSATDFLQLLMKERAAGNITIPAVNRALDKFLDTYSQAKESGKLQGAARYPIIFIDEANELSEWRKEDGPALIALLQNIMLLTKEQQRAHVVMATSDYTFQQWLQAGVVKSEVNVLVLGNFREEEARTFFNMKYREALTAQVEAQAVRVVRAGVVATPAPEAATMATSTTTPKSQSISTASVDDVSWKHFYAVAGGNASQLSRLAIKYDGGNLQEALKFVWTVVEPFAKVGLHPPEGAGWSVAQYKAAVSAIVNSNHKAVPRDDLLELLTAAGPGPGDRALWAMVRADLFSYRPYSDMALDLHADVCAAGLPVITAATPAHYYCMKLLLNKWQSSACASATATEAPQPGGVAASISLEKFLVSVNCSGSLQKLQEEKVDMAVLAKCTEEDLRSLGLSFGARRRILEALRSTVKGR